MYDVLIGGNKPVHIRILEVFGDEPLKRTPACTCAASPSAAPGGCGSRGPSRPESWRVARL